MSSADQGSSLALLPTSLAPSWRLGARPNGNLVSVFGDLSAKPVGRVRDLRPPNRRLSTLRRRVRRLATSLTLLRVPARISSRGISTVTSAELAGGRFVVISHAIVNCGFGGRGTWTEGVPTNGSGATSARFRLRRLMRSAVLDYDLNDGWCLHRVDGFPARPKGLIRAGDPDIGDRSLIRWSNGTLGSAGNRDHTRPWDAPIGQRHLGFLVLGVLPWLPGSSIDDLRRSVQKPALARADGP